MTLADFLKLFDFESGIIWINTIGYDCRETLVGAYISKTDIERDFCTRLYRVLEIRAGVAHTVDLVIAR